MVVGIGCCKACPGPYRQEDDAYNCEATVSGTIDRALMTPTENAHGSAARNGDMVTNQRVVLGL